MPFTDSTHDDEIVPISLGELRDSLKMCGEGATVHFDFPPYQKPGQFNSYRGWNNRPALEHFGKDSHNNSSVNMDSCGNTDPEPTVKDLLAQIDVALRDTFEAWKGGEYRYNENSPVHVDNPGEVNNCVVTSVADYGYKVILRTAHYDG